MKKNILILSTVVLLSSLANGVQTNTKQDKVGFSETALSENVNDKAIKLQNSRSTRGEAVNLDAAESNSEFISKVLVQTKTNEDSTKNIRYVAAFKVSEYDQEAESINIAEIGFNVHYIVNGNELNYSYPVSTVYSSINAGGQTYTRDQQGEFVTNGTSYDYFMTYAISDIPLESFGTQITVRPYIKYVGEDNYHTSNSSKVASVYGDMLAQPDWEYTEHVKNGDFEQGLSSWTLSNADSPILSIAASNETYWGGKYYGNGDNFARGDLLEGNTGTMTSEPFMLAGDGYVTARIGGCGDTSKCYITVNDALTGEEVGRMSNTHFVDPDRAENLNFYYINLSDYKGKLLKVVIHDEATGGFGFVEVDDIKTSLTYDEMLDAFKEATSLYEDTDTSRTATSVKNLYFYNLVESTYSLSNANAIQSTKTYQVDGLTFNAELSISKDGVALEANDGVYSLNTIGQYTSVTNYKVDGKTIYTRENTFNVEGIYNVCNGDFETGNLSGWTVLSGNVNEDNAVLGDKTFWNERISYNQGGNYHFDGWKACTEEAAGYSLKSTNFILSGTGMISFKLGGNAARLSVYNADGTKIKTFKNGAFADVHFPYVGQGSRLATMVSYYADLSEYLNQELYIVIEDKVISSSWAVAFFDDIVTYYEIETAATLSTRKDTVQESNNGEDVTIDWVVATEE